MRFPIRARLTAIFVVLTAAVLVGAGLLLYARLGSGLDEAVDRDITSRARAIAQQVDTQSGDAAALAGLLRGDDLFAEVVGDGGRVLTSSPDLGGALALPAGEIGSLEKPMRFGRTVVAGGERVDARFVAYPTGTGKVVLVGSSLEDRNRTLAKLSRLLWIGIPLAVFAMGVIIWALSGAALRPVDRLRRQAHALSLAAGDRRLEVPRTGDELERLGGTLNRMLQRVSEAWERERRMVDDASHELRTPLSILKAELDTGLRRSRTREDLESSMRSAAEECERLIRLADDLLVLARSNRGRLRVQREPVAAGELLESAAEPFREQAEARGVTLEVRADASEPIEVDPVWLRQALANLLDNALRHTRRGGRIVLTARDGPTGVSLAVTDSGVGFPPAGSERVFEPFWRGGSSRNRASGGAGLGLTIVAAIAGAHGGMARAGNASGGGGRVTLEIPRMTRDNPGT